MWKKLAVICAALLGALCIASCMGPDQQTKVEESAPGPPLKIYCSFLPVYCFTANVITSRKNISLEVVIRDDMSNPSLCRVSEERAKEVAAADMLIINGLGIDAFLVDAVSKVNPNIKILDCSSGIEAFNLKNPSSSLNPYVWMSPRKAILQVRNIQKAIGEIDREGAKEINKQADKYVKILEGLGDSLDKAVKDASNRRVVLEGDIFDYLARDYGLEVVGNITLNKAERSNALESLKDLVTAQKVQAVFLEAGTAVSPQKEKALHEGLPLFYLATMQSGSTYPDAYDAMMKKNITFVKAALQGSR
ncbi:MAG: metal ABC transporter substrate-binding protein [Candidatus Eremiobacteraeota bacterium]|nr:metal ABC transporter substrate-binding protein [Candidatus Eremiobacteraeota bacterium]